MLRQATSPWQPTARLAGDLERSAQAEHNREKQTLLAPLASRLLLANDRFAVARIIKAYSPRLSQASLRQSPDTKKHLDDVNAAIDMLMELWKDGADPALLQVLQCVAKHDLFEIPDPLKANASGAIEKAAAESSEEDERGDPQ